MKSDLVKVIILSAIFVRGQMLKEGDEVEVNQREAKELLNRGVATDEKEVEIKADSFNEMTLVELGEVDYKKLNKDPLIEFATACGLEISEETKPEIYALIDDIDFEGEE